MRDTTERPEAVEAGTVWLVGTEQRRIVEGVSALLSDAAAYAAVSQAHNPYGDGQACSRIVQILRQTLRPNLGIAPWEQAENTNTASISHF